ncbi:hypothetical protein, partial [Bifidobacterium primatium]|uniref:hypothetical protein n=1 Tax=Bifidobacterium primatium TaxID=2045438 RepID=UPI0013FDE0E9
GTTSRPEDQPETHNPSKRQPNQPEKTNRPGHQLAIKNKNSVVQNTLLSSQTTTTPTNQTHNPRKQAGRAGQRVRNLHQPTPQRKPKQNNNPKTTENKRHPRRVAKRRKAPAAGLSVAETSIKTSNITGT